MGAKPATQGGGFAHGKPVPEERRCQGIKADGSRCTGWTIKSPDGDGYLPLCLFHSGHIQRRWSQVSEERRLERRRTLDAERKREARAKDRTERLYREQEEREAIERARFRQHHQEQERKRLQALKEERLRRHPPDFPKPKPGEVWDKSRCDYGRYGSHEDEHGSFVWRLRPIDVVVQQERDRALAEAASRRELMLRPTTNRRRFIEELNAARRNRLRDQERLLGA